VTAIATIKNTYSNTTVNDKIDKINIEHRVYIRQNDSNEWYIKEKIVRGENKGGPKVDCPPLPYSASTLLATPRFRI